MHTRQPGSRPETPADKPTTRKTPGTIPAPPRSLRTGTRFTRAYTHARTCEPANWLKSPVSRQNPVGNITLRTRRPKRPINDFSASAGHSRVNARGQKLPSLRTGWKNVNSNFVFLFSATEPAGAARRRTNSPGSLANLRGSPLRGYTPGCVRVASPCPPPVR